FFTSRRRHTRCYRDWSSDVCSSDLPRRELDRAIHDDAALARRERRDVGPAAGKVETHRGGRVEFGGLVAPLHGAVRHPATVGNSPRTSIRTPLTRRFIPCTPRAWYRNATGSESRKKRCARAGSGAGRTPASSARVVK